MQIWKIFLCMCVHVCVWYCIWTLLLYISVVLFHFQHNLVFPLETHTLRAWLDFRLTTIKSQTKGCDQKREDEMKLEKDVKARRKADVMRSWLEIKT